MLWYTHFGSFHDVPEDVTRLFGLILNPMRGRTEEARLICVSDMRQEIEQLLDGERVEPYSDPGPGEFGEGTVTWYKVFRKDGPLEWFNPPGGAYFGTGVAEFRRDGWRRVA